MPLSSDGWGDILGTGGYSANSFSLSGFGVGGKSASPSSMNAAGEALKLIGKGIQAGSIIGQGYIQSAQMSGLKTDYLTQALVESMKQDLLKFQLSQQITRYGQARAELLRAYNIGRQKAVNNAVARGVAINSGSALATLAGLDMARQADVGQQRANFENQRMSTEISLLNSQAQEKAYRSAASAIDTSYPIGQTLLSLAGLFAG